jgi:hypothetical protein
LKSQIKLLKLGEFVMRLPTQSQPVLRNGSTANISGKTGVTASSGWNCAIFFGTQPDFKGYVETPWSDEVGAGVWACNNWISACGSEPGGCEALRA